MSYKLRYFFYLQLSVDKYDPYMKFQEQGTKKNLKIYLRLIYYMYYNIDNYDG